MAAFEDSEALGGLVGVANRAKTVHQVVDAFVGRHPSRLFVCIGPASSLVLVHLFWEEEVEELLSLFGALYYIDKSWNLVLCQRPIKVNGGHLRDGDSVVRISEHELPSNAPRPWLTIRGATQASVKLKDDANTTVLCEGSALGHQSLHMGWLERRMPRDVQHQRRWHLMKHGHDV